MDASETSQVIDKLAEKAGVAADVAGKLGLQCVAEVQLYGLLLTVIWTVMAIAVGIITGVSLVKARRAYATGRDGESVPWAFVAGMSALVCFAFVFALAHDALPRLCAPTMKVLEAICK